MPFTLSHALEPSIDIRGTTSPASNLSISDEPLGLGAVVPGKSGVSSTITAVNSGIATIGGLSGFSDSDVGKFIQFTGANNAGNNGTFLIVQVNSASSVNVNNSGAIFPDANSGTINWVERYPYSLQDDLNYVRTDRAAIKGTTYSANIPTYQRPTAIGTNVSANLSNIAGKTTDAVIFNANRVFYQATVALSDSRITVNSTGNLKHVNTTDTSGIPIFDTAPFDGDFVSCYVAIYNSSTGKELFVTTGLHAGEKIFGVTNKGSSTSPNSVEVVFYSCPVGSDISTNSSAYSWEATQPTSITVVYSYGQRLDQLDKNILRNLLTLNFSSNPVSTPSGWEITGDTVKLIDNTDQVAIGTSTLLGSEKLRVVGDITINGSIIADAASSFTTSSGAATVDGFTGVLLKGNGTTGLSVNAAGTLVTITNGLTLSALSTGILHSSVSGVISSSLIVNADVSVSAAIDGSKISPVFGAQAVTTTTGFVGPSLDTVGASTLSIGTSNTNGITIGKTGLTTINNGSLIVAQVVTLSSLGTGLVHSNNSGVLSSSLLVDTDVASNAAIAGTKISPTFGAQLVSTTTGFQGPYLDTGAASDLSLRRNGSQIAAIQSTGLSVTGSTTTSTVFLGSAGSADAPTHSFTEDSDTGLYNPSANVCGISTNGVVRLQVSDNTLTFAQGAASSGSPNLVSISGGTHTGLTASTEAIDVNINLSHTVTFATGALTTQRAMLVQAPTYAFAGASTLTNAATLAISGAPIAGTNATLTNTWSLWVQGGASRFDGTIDCPGVGTNSQRLGASSTATGTNGIAIGRNSQADGTNVICIGTGSTITGSANSTVVIGNSINTTSSGGVAIGHSANNWAGGVSIGQSANCGSNGVAIGQNSASNSSNNIIIGNSAQAGGLNNISIGRSAIATGSGGAQDSIAIGASANTGFTQVICIGSSATATAANQALLGGTNTSITNLFIGKGVASATPATNITVQSTAGSGTGVSGSNLILTPGKAGDAATAGGLFKIQTSPAGSGTSLVDALTIAASGAVTMTSPTINYATSQNGVWRNTIFVLIPPLTGVSIPAMTQIDGSAIFAPAWALNDHLWIFMQIQHDYAIGTNIYFNIEWFTNGTNTNTVVWQLTYYFARAMAQDSFGFGGVGTTITITQAPSGIAYQHMTAESTAITIANLEPDTMIIGELKRISNGGTNNTDTVFAVTTSISYQSNTPGTKNRNPNFYT